MTKIESLSDDLLSPEMVGDPYPYLHTLRETAPVHWNERWGGWLLTGYDAIARIHADPRLSNDKYGPFATLKNLSDDQRAVFDWLALWMGSQDPPLHTRLRKSVQSAFSSRDSLDAVAPVIGATAAKLLDELEVRSQFDVVNDFAYPLTRAVIAGMLGMPPGDAHRIAPWSDAVSPLMFMMLGGDKEKRYRQAREQLNDMAGYFRGALRRRRQQPQDDLMTSLSESVDRGELSEDEAVATCMTVLFGGHETTKDLIGNGVLLLLRHPEQLARLRQDPALWPSAVEEILRYEGPAKSTVRWAKEDITIEGQRIAAGQRILVFWAAANRDPGNFPEPDRFDVARRPNPHLSFGHGAHYCLGAALGRREGVIALPLLFDRMPGLQLAVDVDDLEWCPNIIMRGLVSLPVATEEGR